MATREETLEIVVKFLHERYDVSTKMQREIKRLQDSGNEEAVQAIISEKSYRKDTQTRFNLPELVAALELPHSSLYYVLLTSNNVFIKLKQQAPDLLNLGIAIEYPRGTNKATRAKFFYDPGVLYQAVMANYGPAPVVIQPFQPPTIQAAPVEVKYEVSTNQYGKVTDVTPTGVNAPAPCELTHCPEDSLGLREHDWVRRMKAFSEEHFVGKAPEFGDKTWADCIGHLLNGYVKVMAQREQTPEN